MSPDAPPLPRPVIMDQVWADLVFLHWRIDSSQVAERLPAGSWPDEYDGSSWIGLIGFVMQRAGIGFGHPVPYFGDFGEINVRLYSTDAQGRRGVVFASLETERLAVAVGANLARVRYRWSRVSVDRAEGRVGYRSTRLGPPGRGATTDFAVTYEEESHRQDPLAVFLTARWGMHTSAFGRPLFVPNAHGRWPLRGATLTRCEDQLVAVAGFPGVTSRPPDSVLYSPGVRTQFGRPYRIRS